MAESWHSIWLRWRFNWFPAYRATGGRIRYVAADFSEVRVELGLNRRTRNYHGTIFGGSMYGALDPIHAIMLIQRLGPDYRVWVKSARVEFLKPGRGMLHATCRIPDGECDRLRGLLQETISVEPSYEAELNDAQGTPHARITVTLHIRRAG
ncbi:MAG: DUF4442 domain-containing protein [Candidatus Sericytochromatia bacterium]|nr:DUF4442 domain-containing protein [Candidatus Sericytochromatia bacterium]